MHMDLKEKEMWIVQSLPNLINKIFIKEDTKNRYYL